MNRVYPAIIHEEEGSYWVEFPDLEGCNSIGDSLEECMVNVEEALGGYLAVLLENGDEIPKASRLEKMNIPVRRSRHSGKLETANPEQGTATPL